MSVNFKVTCQVPTRFAETMNECQRNKKLTFTVLKSQILELCDPYRIEIQCTIETKTNEDGTPELVAYAEGQFLSNYKAFFKGSTVAYCRGHCIQDLKRHYQNLRKCNHINIVKALFY